ncbi:Uncharacterised protein [Staphylococcus caprae]|nr:Uncharacterised protein [Staphylococcus caprae]
MNTSTIDLRIAYIITMRVARYSVDSIYTL